MPNDVHVTASAIAAFEATQVAFVALVKKGILSKAEAETALRKAIEVIKTETTGDQAAELLAGLSERLPAISQRLGNKALAEQLWQKEMAMKGKR